MQSALFPALLIGIIVIVKSFCVSGHLVMGDMSPSEPVVTMSFKKMCDIPGEDFRFDCFPQGNVTQTQCEDRGCCWKPYAKTSPLSQPRVAAPDCFYPDDFMSYVVKSVKDVPTGHQARLSMTRGSPYPHDVQNLLVNFELVSESCLRIKIEDADNKRWEPAFTNPQTLKTNSSFKKTKYDYDLKLPVVGEAFKFGVYRSSGEFLLETVPGLVFSDQFLQLSTHVSSPFMYGLGEHRNRLMLDVNWTRITLWNRDHVPQENTNLYGSHPFYISKDVKGWHGVYLHNSNGMDVILQPTPAVTWRPIGGIFDFYIFTGPTIHDVIGQYTNLVGRTFMPPYWALGFQLCWQFYGTANNTLATMNRLRSYGIPQDVQWNDIDYASKSRVYTTDTKNFGDQALLAKEIHNRGMHYIIMVDCGISNNGTPGSYEPYDLGMKMGIFINGSDGKPLEGRVWPGTTVWPDFLNPDSQTYWTQIGKHFHDKVPFDGMWVDMDEISSFVDGSTKGCDPNSTYDEPPYLPGVVGGKLYIHSICPSAVHQISRHYNVHNLYGLYDTIRSHNALEDIRQKRPFVISRSTFSGQGAYGGHWSGDNKATFYDMYKSISSMLHINMYGISVTGSDICGFNGNTFAELCTRWHQLGAFYVFSRNHNGQGNKAQDPGQFGPHSAMSTRKALLTRYSLLPYLYTLLHKSHVFGYTVARPLLFEYPEDSQTYNLDSQFLWGPALMISPVLKENETAVWAYFPKDRWYDFYTGQVMSFVGQYVHLKAPLDVINLHVRGGFVLPMQEPSLTTTKSRKLPFWLLVALNETGQAQGDIFFDDGDSLDSYESGRYNFISFVATNTSVRCSVEKLGYVDEPMTLSNVTVFGLDRGPKTVELNKIEVPFGFVNGVLYIAPLKTASLDVSLDFIWT